VLRDLCWCHWGVQHCCQLKKCTHSSEECDLGQQQVDAHLTSGFGFKLVPSPCGDLCA
jgi:hypothetical protein